jgi:hypothetical protein
MGDSGDSASAAKTAFKNFRDRYQDAGNSVRDSGDSVRDSGDSVRDSGDRLTELTPQG